MGPESVAEKALKLFEDEQFIKDRRQTREKDKVFDKEEISVLEAIAAIPNFPSFNGDQQRVALRLGLLILSNVASRMMSGSCILGTDKLKQELVAALEAGSQLGQEDAQLVLDMAFNAALSAWGVK